MNAAFAAMLGYESPEEVLRLRIADAYVNASDRARVLDSVEHSDRVSGLEVQFKNERTRAPSCSEPTAAPFAIPQETWNGTKSS